jgi:hypothetical protein
MTRCRAAQHAGGATPGPGPPTCSGDQVGGLSQMYPGVKRLDGASRGYWKVELRQRVAREYTLP